MQPVMLVKRLVGHASGIRITIAQFHILSDNQHVYRISTNKLNALIEDLDANGRLMKARTMRRNDDGTVMRGSYTMGYLIPNEYIMDEAIILDE